uniref:Large ribosomal subunit protein mL52 n=1 Tax=Balaenoptera musculus TaxID=9771 RepID=A0A8C0CK14_BALMU
LRGWPRVVLLSQEMDAGLQAWQLRQRKLQEEERKQQNALKPKGHYLQLPTYGINLSVHHQMNG